MNNSLLKLKWSELSQFNIRNGFKSLRISPECLSDIYIGVNSEENRCLILALPKDSKLDLKKIVKENLTIEFFKETDFIVLQLTDNTFYDLFDDLIISLYQRIKDIAQADEYSKEFISTFYKWSEFFADSKSELLSENEIKGLIGELLVLQSLLKSCKSNQINEVLNSWKGPYDKGHDFVLEDRDIEVKTKDVSQLNIRISSEYQLEKEFDKGLELLVVSVEKDYYSGISLKDLILDIKDSTTEMQGDSSIFLKAINQKGLTIKNVNQYDNLRFKPINQIIYNCEPEDFPKIIKSNTPKELNDVKYNIRISSLSRFVLSKKEY